MTCIGSYGLTPLDILSLERLHPESQQYKDGENLRFNENCLNKYCKKEKHIRDMFFYVSSLTGYDTLLCAFFTSYNYDIEEVIRHMFMFNQPQANLDKYKGIMEDGLKNGEIILEKEVVKIIPYEDAINPNVPPLTYRCVCGGCGIKIDPKIADKQPFKMKGSGATRHGCESCKDKPKEEFKYKGGGGEGGE